jgi:hypothetical protein
MPPVHPAALAGRAILLLAPARLPQTIRNSLPPRFPALKAGQKGRTRRRMRACMRVHTDSDLTLRLPTAIWPDDHRLIRRRTPAHEPDRRTRAGRTRAPADDEGCGADRRPGAAPDIVDCTITGMAAPS